MIALCMACYDIFCGDLFWGVVMMGSSVKSSLIDDGMIFFLKLVN